MVARCRSCCIHKETSRFLHWWLSVHTCFQIALNGIGQVFTTKKKKNSTLWRSAQKFPKSPQDYSFINFHTRQHSCQPWDFWVLWTDQSNIRPKEKNTPASSKVNLQSLMTSLEINKSFDLSWKPYQRPYHDFPVNFQRNYCRQPNCFLGTSCVVRSIAAFFFLSIYIAFATWRIYFSFFLLHRLLNNATMPQKRL